MPTTEYPKNPNTDTAFVTDDNNHRTRAVKTVQMDGTIDYPSNPNSDSCYVTVDGKKQRALMVADISSAGTLDYPENSNSTKGYVTVNGKKQRVTMTASLVGGGGSTPVIDELNVTPSTSAQTITAPSGVDGYSPVNVSAVTSAIDANIVAGNIKKDVQILGVTGSYEGQTPTGTKSITANGVYDVTDFASADVQVPTTAPAHYVEKAVDADGKLINSTNIIDLTGVKDVNEFVLSDAYYKVHFPANTSINFNSLLAVTWRNACDGMFLSSTGITNVNLSSLTTVSGNYGCNNMFNGCTGITNVNLSSLTTVSGQSGCSSMFNGCTGITNVNLSSLTTVSGQSGCSSMFNGCTGITSLDLSSLTTISGKNACNGMFYGCSGLTTVKFNALNTITEQIAPSFGQMFAGCTHLESVEFGGLRAGTFASRKDQFAYLFNAQTGSQATNGCTVHFPSNFDPSDPNHTFDASTLTGYPTFGGSASYIHVAFDLPATES